MYRWYNDSSGFHPFTGDGGFSFFAGKFGLHIGHNNMMFQNYGSSVSCGVIRDIKLGAKYLLTLTSYFIKYGTVIIISERGFLS